MKTYTLYELARMIDHTNLHAFATTEDLETLCREARENHFASAVVNSGQAKRVSELLLGSDIATCVTAGFPLGQTSVASKVFETRDALFNGAREIDYVVNVTEVKAHNWTYISDEMKSIVQACNEAGALSKVIFENCYLTDDEKKQLCEIANDCDVSFVKTSTGFGTGGATPHDVELMRKYTKDSIKVKAAGGIRTAEDFLEYLRLGAERFGCSAGMEIMAELREMGESVSV